MNLKAVDTKFIDIKNRSALGDFLVITSGTSSRHINSIASKIIEYNKKKVFQLKVLNQQSGLLWILVI